MRATIAAMGSFWLYWGKARPVDGSDAAFHLLPYHCLDVAAVATTYLSAVHALRRWLASKLGVASEEALVAWAGSSPPR